MWKRMKNKEKMRKEIEKQKGKKFGFGGTCSTVNM